MKTLKESVAILIFFGSMATLISWKLFGGLKTGNWKEFGYSDSADLVTDDVFDDSDSSFFFNKPPVKEVYVQKLKGDRDHLLIIAKINLNNNSRKYFRLDIDEHDILFRDDGKENDKTDGDGLFTAKVRVNVSEFSRLAFNLSLRPAPPRFTFDGREIVRRNTDKSLFRFDEGSFDANQMVSITNLGVNAASSGLIDHSLMITNLGVVEDSTRTWNSCAQTGNVDGPWTFKTLMKQLASTNPANLATDEQVSSFVLNWLNSWVSQQIINGDTVNARTRINNKIIQPWLDKSFEAGAPAGQLDMRFAPFKLLAIVNRLDLRTNLNKIPGIAFGEGRFIFGLINNTCTDHEEFTVIFEYGIPTKGCKNRLNYVLEWFRLKDSTLGSPGYNAALQHITDQFSLCGTSITRPNQSSLDQIRTNDVAIAPFDDPRWQLREFVIDSASHQLKQTTVKKEAAKIYNAKVDNADVQRMVNFINNTSNKFGKSSFLYPDSLEGVPFLAGASLIDNPPTGDTIPNVYHWDGTGRATPASFIVSGPKRQNFSINACSGCHAGETQTGFTHVDPVFFGQEATLSGFLTGRAGRIDAFDFDGDPDNGIFTVKDAAGRPFLSPALRGFNDLERRATDLETLAATTCGTVLQIRNSLLFEPLGMTH